MMNTSNPWKTKSSTIKYDNPWITVRHNDVITPGGQEGIYGKVEFKNIAVGVIPLDDDYNTWIVGQYRYTIDDYSWEIPEGGCLKGHEDKLSAIKRELKEETGIMAENWQEIMEMYTSNSVTDEIAHLFVAKKLSFGSAQPEDTELLKIKKLPFAELVSIAHNGGITDAMSIAAILKTDYLISKGLL